MSGAWGKRFEDRFDQVVCSADGSNETPRDDRAGDLAAGLVFAVAKEQVGQLGLAERRQQFSRGRALRRVKTHVERAPGLKAKAAIGIGKLIR
jgi:hypothetical protein